MSEKILVIVESPAKIKKISSILGKDYTIKASYGHISELSKDDKKHPLGIDIEKQYKPIYKIIPDKKDKIQAIIDAAKQVDKIYIASDPDREGEAIAWHVKQYLESTGKPIYRITFNEITSKAILDAVKKPRDIDNNLFGAQQARQVLDRVVGWKASDFLRSYTGKNLSAGRCQSVSVRLIVEREREIEKFVAEEYWSISVGLAKEKDNKGFIAKYTGKLKNKNEADKVRLDLEKDNYVVEKVEAKVKEVKPPAPYETASIQKAGAKLGFGAKQLMQLLQTLYEQGLITYMRTDSTNLSDDFITNCRNWLKDNKYDLPKKPNVYSSKAGAQEAHEGIHVTDVSKKPETLFLDESLMKVYRLVWERSISCQMMSAQFDTMNIIVKSSSNHELKANGRSLKYEGWLAIEKGTAKEKDDEDDLILPPLKVKDKLELFPPKVKAEQKFTQPPSRYSESSLIETLKKLNIGRPSTYATIVETIKSRGYVEMKGKTYIATETGKQVTDKLIELYKFLDYKYTAKMEDDLDKIAEGKDTYFDVIDRFYTNFLEEWKKSKKESSIGCGLKCECGGDYKLLRGKFGPYVKCPSCNTNRSVDLDKKGNVTLKAKFEKKDQKLEENILCPICSSPTIERKSTYGSFYGCSKYPKCKGIVKK